MAHPVHRQPTEHGSFPSVKMKTSLVFPLLLVLCYLCRAHKHSSDNDILSQVPNVESGEDRAETWRPGTEDDGDEQEPGLLLDILAQLRDLRDMVIEQQVELRHLTSRVTAAQNVAEALQEENKAVEARMTSAESMAEEPLDEIQWLQSLQLLSRISAHCSKDRLTASEKGVQELEKQQEGQKAAVQELEKTNRVMETRMTVVESLAEGLQMENDGQATELAVAQQNISTLQQRLTVSEQRVQELEKQQEGQKEAVRELQNTNKVRQLAFSASLLVSGDGNTYNDYARLIFRNVLANIGIHYDPNTGCFTAPVRGVYFFIFSGQIKSSDTSMLMSLVKNKQRIFTSGDRFTTSADPEDNVSNHPVLHLEMGDVVWVQHFGKVWDDQYHRTTFTGFMLFPL